MLENGKIVNSQAEEYDVNGYIIVFTSNISKDDFKKKISPELRSRFDYVASNYKSTTKSGTKKAGTTKKAAGNKTSDKVKEN